MRLKEKFQVAQVELPPAPQRPDRPTDARTGGRRGQDLERAIHYLLHRGEHEPHDLGDDHDAGGAEMALDAGGEQQG